MVGYPAVWWPEHPASVGQGLAHIHRIRAYEKYGSVVFGMHVHHRNGNPLDFSANNLDLFTPQAHASLHNRQRHMCRKMTRCHQQRPRRKTIRCQQCQKSFLPFQRSYKFCGQKCYRRSREVTDWPSRLELLKLTQILGYSGTGRKLGVSDVAVKKRLRLRGMLEA